MSKDTNGDEDYDNEDGEDDEDDEVIGCDVLPMAMFMTAPLIRLRWSLYQELPRAIFQRGTKHPELSCGPRSVESHSHVLDYDPLNPPPAVVHFHCEALFRYIKCVCQPEVGQFLFGVQITIFFAQDEDIFCGESTRLLFSTQNRVVKASL